MNALKGDSGYKVTSCVVPLGLGLAARLTFLHFIAVAVLPLSIDSLNFIKSASRPLLK